MSSLRFLSHLRTGLAATLSGAGTLPNAQAAYSLTVAGVPMTGQYRLFGPGEVAALDPGEVTRCYPPPDCRDHEPNLFAHVELRSADLPWRFTPAGPTGNKLRPWLVLVVVEPGEKVTLEQRSTGLPVLKTPVSELPSLAETWAWSHVQLTLDGPAPADHQALQGLYEREPQRFVARLICPRKLEPRANYLACLVPAYDVGRDAGLGQSVAGRTVLEDAWSSDMTEVSLPVYHAWRFGCSSRGDFEFLVERLQPRTAPPDLGVGELDLGAPGLGLPAVTTPVPIVGALCAPGAVARLPAPQATETKLRNQLWTVVQAGATVPLPSQADDPVLAPPCYGSAQAGVMSAAPWQQVLNREPGWRAIAGLGAEFVRTHQEDLAASAWQQLEPVARLQRTLRRDALKEAANQRHRQRLAALSEGQGDQYLVFARASCATVRVADKTLLQRLREDTDVPPEAASAAAARLAVRAGRIRRRRALPSPSAAGMTRACMSPASRPDFAPRPGPGGRTQASRMQPVDMSKLKTLSVAAAGTDAKLQALHPGKGRVPRPPATQEFRGAPGLGKQLWDATDPSRFIRAQRRRSVEADPALGLGTEGALPARLQPQLTFATPFGSALAKTAPEYLMPRAGALPPDTIATVAVNTAFVEAFLAGVNDEWEREMVWREIPARPRSTSMRRFWDCEDPGDQIPAIRQWSKSAKLGSNATALAGGSGLALLIKGRLLERYPQTMVYAVRARWENGRREPVTAPTAQQILWPEVTGELSRGVHFLVFFNLGMAQANGTDLAGVNPKAPGSADPGWFFVLEEQAAAPRFGLDLPAPGATVAAPLRWDELHWGQVATATAGGTGARHLALTPPRGVKVLDGVTWAAGAAEMAWITLQTPYRVYLHGSSMLGPTASAAGSRSRVAPRGQA